MTYVLSVGGSLIVPNDNIDFNFLKSFRRFILKRYNVGDCLIIVVGGGTTARKYIQAAKNLKKISVNDLDWLGIYATRINAYLVKTLLKDIAYSEIITNPKKTIKTRSRVIIASGYYPGFSTDYVAVFLANKYQAKIVINLSNIDYIYNKDPRFYKNAKIIKEITWSDFRKIVGNKWSPGLNTPFDPIAARLAQSLNLKAVILNGHNFSNLNNFFTNNYFKGTIIQ